MLVTAKAMSTKMLSLMEEKKSYRASMGPFFLDCVELNRVSFHRPLLRPDVVPGGSRRAVDGTAPLPRGS
jgi:hypothetical protein